MKKLDKKLEPLHPRSQWGVEVFCYLTSLRVSRINYFHIEQDLFYSS